MPTIGSFGYDVTVDSLKGVQALDALIRRASEAQTALDKLRSGNVTINAGAARQALTQLGNQAQALKAQGNIAIAVRTDGGQQSNAALTELLQRTKALQAGAQIRVPIQVDGGAQAEQQILAVQKALTAARAGDRVVFPITGDARQMDALLKRLDVDLKAAQAKGAKIRVDLDTRDAEAKVSHLNQIIAAVGRGAVQGSGAGSGFLLGAGAGAGAIAALGVATAVSQVTGALVGAIKAGLEYNRQIETATKTLELFTGSAGQTQKALTILRQYADFTPFDTDEVIAGGQAFIKSVDGDIAAMERLIHLSGQLAATNPDVKAGGGFESATIALREALGGQTESIAERFNIPRSTIQSLKDAGLSGIALAEALVKAAHGSEELVQTLSGTATGQLSNFRSALANLGKTATEPLFAELTATVKDLNTSLSTNQGGWNDWAKSVGAAIAYPLREARALGEALAFIGSRLPAAQDTPQRGRGEFGLFGPTSQSSARDVSTSPPFPGSQVGAGGAGAPSVAIKVVAPTAAELKAQAEKLGKELKEFDDDVTRHATQALDDQIAANRKAAAEKKQTYEDTRDAAIKAADATRDASVAGLDREQQARDRGRVQQDRAIADQNSAILRNLEQQHNATLKGLDSELGAIQKRGDLALKGLDSEISAVDRKRDAALRALEDESRAESRRHSEALRNIDRERDAKLGVIDKQLAALDAAAQRDQRRQTDQAEQRALADDKRALKQANTPEERARARRAIADDQEAIRREAVNRQREDQRAALRAQADAIRAAAEAQKTAEGTRNTGATDALSQQKQAVADQAKADTERLNAVKERVKVQTEIEAQSIRERVEAENAGYQETVRDQQRAFELQARALQDQRTSEDIALADRRKAVQTIYDSAVEAARTTADGQIKELERQTGGTVTELDKQKRAWSEWKEYVQGQIAEAMKSSNVDALRNLSVVPPSLQNAGSGTGEPPSRGNLPAQTPLPPIQGPEVPVDFIFVTPEVTAEAQAAGAEVATAVQAGAAGVFAANSFFAGLDTPGLEVQAQGVGAAVGSAVSAGLADGIGGEESQKAVKAATEDVIQKGIVQPAVDKLDLGSPSKLFTRFGQDTAQGFINGFASVDILAAGRRPFEDLETWINPGFANLMQNDGSAAAAAWQTGYQTRDIYAAGRLPFEQLNVWMAGLPARMSASGAAAAAAFGTGFVARNPGVLIENTVATAMNDLGRLNPNFQAIGHNFATFMTNGFDESLREWHVLQGQAAAQQTQARPFGHNAAGGFAPAGRLAFFGEQGPEFGLPPQAGSILPADVSRNLMMVASGQLSGGGERNVTVNVNVNATGADIGNPDGFANRIQRETVRAVVQLLDHAEQNSPDAVPNTLAGAM